MKIVMIGSSYHIETESGFKQITQAEALNLYEKGFVTDEEVLTYEYD